MQSHMEHASSNGAVMTPNGHIRSPYMPFHGPGTPYHMAMMASHAELLRYHNVSPAGGQYAGPPVSMANGHMYPPQQSLMYHMSYPGLPTPLPEDASSCFSLPNFKTPDVHGCCQPAYRPCGQELITTHVAVH